jgi:hypothetical protein
LRCKAESWKARLDVLARPTASPISRIDGRRPRSCTESLMAALVGAVLFILEDQPAYLEVELLGYGR